MAKEKPESKTSENRVLIIEDDALLCGILSDALVAEGYEVSCVGDGSKALDTIKKIVPSLILLDLILPGIDGFEVMKQIRADSDIADIPVAVISNLDEVADVKSIRALGADEYFIKANSDVAKIVKYVKRKV